MPNEANKSKDKSGIVQKKKKPTMPVTDKQATEGAAPKRNSQKGKAGSSSKESKPRSA